MMARHWCTDHGRVNEQVAESNHRLLVAKSLELAGPNPSALVLSLACTAACCWWEVNWRLVNLQVNRVQHPDASDIAYNRALKRWLAVCRTLASVQRMAPMIQVNIAHGPQQVVNERPG